MSIYANELSALYETLQASAGRLTTYANKANSATTYATYKAYVDKYNNEKATYDATVAKYEDTSDQYSKYITVISTSSILVDVPSIKDKNQNLAGGIFGTNGALPGGIVWSPTATPSMVPAKPSIDKTTNLMNGNILSFLGWGFGEVSNLLQGGQLNLMFDDDIKETSTIRTVVTITLPTGMTTVKEAVYSYGGGNSSTSDGEEGGIGESYSYNGEPMSLEDMNAMMSGRTNSTENMIGMLSGFTPLGQIPFGSVIAIAAYNVATGQEVKAQQLIGRTLVNNVLSTFSNAFTKEIALTFNLTSIPAVLGLSFAVGSVLQEAFEVAVGLDNHFGFGGEYLGTKADGTAVYGAPIGAAQGLLDTVTEIATFGIADTATYNGVGAEFSAVGYTYDGQLTSTADLNMSWTTTPDINWGELASGLSQTTYADNILNASIAQDFGDTSDISNVYSGVNATLADFNASMDEDFATNSAQTAADAARGGFLNEHGGYNSLADAQAAHEAAASAYGSNKIICTAMNKRYGFGSFRNKIWLAYARKNLTKAHEVGYHTMFKPLVKWAYDDDIRWIREILEFLVVHRSIDLRAEMTNSKRHRTGQLIRLVFEPLCRLVGKTKQKISK